MIVHVGYPKCGSSFLQENVFPGMEKTPFFNVDITRNTLASLIRDDEIDYIKPQIKKGLYSSENLCTIGNPQVNIRSRTAKRLKDAGFKKVIICIRNQKTIIDSLYRQFIQDGRSVSFKFYLNNFIIFEFLDYNKTIQLYEKLFNPENVKVLVIETLKNQETMDDLSEFIEDKIHIKSTKRRNESLSNFSIGLLIFLNHFLSSRYRPSLLIPSRLTSWKVKQVLLIIDKLGFRKRNYMDKNKKNIILDMYRVSNKTLSKRLNLNLENYNYPI